VTWKVLLISNVDPKLNKLGAAYRWSLTRLAENMADQGTPKFTQELYQRYHEELWDPRRKITSGVVFTWARKWI